MQADRGLADGQSGDRSLMDCWSTGDCRGGAWMHSHGGKRGSGDSWALGSEDTKRWATGTQGCWADLIVQSVHVTVKPPPKDDNLGEQQHARLADTPGHYRTPALTFPRRANVVSISSEDLASPRPCRERSQLVGKKLWQAFVNVLCKAAHTCVGSCCMLVKTTSMETST